MMSSSIGARATWRSRPSALVLALALVVAWGSACPKALAQSNGQQSNAKDQSVAQALFDAARVLMDAGKYDDAAAKFAESQRLDPAPGTLLNLAVCHEQLGKTATAWAEYNDVLAIGRKDGNVERQRIAAARIHAIEPKLARISIVPASADIHKDLSITLDALIIRPAAVGVAIPVDPGPHQVEVRAPGKTRWSWTTDALAAGALQIVNVPALADAPRLDDVSARARVAPVPAPDRRRRASYVVGVGALAGFAAAGYFGYLAKTEWDVHDTRCVPDCDNSPAEDARRRALTLAHVADASIAVGLVGAGVAAYLFLTSSPTGKTSSSSRVLVGPTLATAGGGMTIAYRGRF